MPSSWVTFVLISPVCDRHTVLQILRPPLQGDYPGHNVGRRRQLSAADIRGGRRYRTLLRAIHPWTALSPGGCQKCRNIIADANFQGNKSTAFSTKMRKQGLDFFYALVSILTGPVGGPWETVSFLLLGWHFGDMCFNGRWIDYGRGWFCRLFSKFRCDNIFFSDNEGDENVRRFFTTMTGGLSSWFFSINTSAG